MRIGKIIQDRRYNPTVLSALGLRETSGDIGLEIELEGNKFIKTNRDLPSMWTYHEDHSLRGEDNAEYVYKKPRRFDQVEDDVIRLFGLLNEFGTVLDDSNRTSVHVHLNCQKFYANRMAAFAGLYFSVEDLLTRFAGDHREGNLFCLRAKDAPAILTKIRKMIQNNFEYPIADGMHYAAFNVQALWKFGSVEIRTLRGATEPKLIVDWVKMLERIYRLSEEFPDPREIVNMFSYMGPMGYLSHVFGDSLPTLMSGVNLYEYEVRDMLYEGIRRAQEICFCKDWSLFKAEEPVDPFGRPPKMSAYTVSSLSNMAAPQFATYATLGIVSETAVMPSFAISQEEEALLNSILEDN